MLPLLQDLIFTSSPFFILYFLSFRDFFFHFQAPQSLHHPSLPFFTTPIHFILLHFIVPVTLFDSSLLVSFSPPRLLPHLLSNSLFMSSSLQITPLSRQHPGYSSITNAQDLWVTAARLYCHNMIVLYMRETHTPACTHAHVSFDVHAGLLEHAPLLLPK